MTAPTVNAETCQRCGARAATVLLRLSSGHVGRACPSCRTLRKGKPYASKIEYQNATADARKGRGLPNANTRR